MEIKMPLDEKILKFANDHDLYILGQKGRDRANIEVRCYTIATGPNITLGTIKPDCTYEQFLEVVASKAISEAERLYVLNDELEQDYEDLYGNFVAFKEEEEEEATDEG